MRRFRFESAQTQLSPEGKHAVGFGLRVGYWPCLRAPYVTIYFGARRFDFWHGLPGYKSDTWVA